MLRLGLVIATLTAVTLPLIPLQWLSITLRLPSRRAIPVIYHRLVCRLLGVRIHLRGECVKPPVLIVSNHVSWLDIPVITALLPAVFVAKREVASWPLFGLFAKLQRSVFVDRERRHNTADASTEIAARLAEGDPVVLFAEGTSSDGNRVLAFRSSLLGAAQMAPRPDGTGGIFIQPLSIAYIGLDGFPIGRQHRPLVGWYGAMDLLPHLGEIIRRGAVDVVVSWGEPIRYNGRADRKATSRAMEVSVRRMTAAALREPLPVR